MGIECGLSEEDILEKLEHKLNVSRKKAQEYFQKYAAETVYIMLFCILYGFFFYLVKWFTVIQKNSQQIKEILIIHIMEFIFILPGFHKYYQFVILGMENQGHIHYAMPMRVMGYDYGFYKKQYDSNAKRYKTAEGLSEDEYLSKMRETDKLIPVIFQFIVQLTVRRTRNRHYH